MHTVHTCKLSHAKTLPKDTHIKKIQTALPTHAFPKVKLYVIVKCKNIYNIQLHLQLMITEKKHTHTHTFRVNSICSKGILIKSLIQRFQRDGVASCDVGTDWQTCEERLTESYCLECATASLRDSASDKLSNRIGHRFRCPFVCKYACCSEFVCFNHVAIN